MSVTFDPSTDFETVGDGLEIVTLQVYGEDDQTIEHAHRNQVTMKEAAASNGLARQGDTIWQWPLAETPTRPPLGSVIVDGKGDRWTILGIDEQLLGSKWSATCRNLAVEAQLDTLVTIQAASCSKDDAGEAIPSWGDLITDVRARVQPVAAAPDVDGDQNITDLKYEIILEQDWWSLLSGYTLRIVDAGGTVYRVDDYRRPERIDALPVVLATKLIE